MCFRKMCENLESQSSFDSLTMVTSLVVDEVTVVGSRCGPFGKAIDLLESGNMDLGALIDDTFPLDQAVDALSQSRTSGTLKVLLDMR